MGSPTGRIQMLMATETRQIAASLAGAFLTAMLFVSAAVGPLPLLV